MGLWDFLFGKAPEPVRSPFPEGRSEILFPTNREAWEFMGEWLANPVKIGAPSFGIISRVVTSERGNVDVEVDLPSNAPQKTLFSMNYIKNINYIDGLWKEIDPEIGPKSIGIEVGALVSLVVFAKGPFKEPLNFVSFLDRLIAPQMHIEKGWKEIGRFGHKGKESP